MIDRQHCGSLGPERVREQIACGKPRHHMGLVSEKGAGRFVGRTDEAAVEVMDQHGQRVALEQQTEVLFLLLEIGNVDADANRSASFDLALLDQDRKSVVEGTSVSVSV